MAMVKENSTRIEELVKAMEETGILMEEEYYKSEVEAELLEFQKLLISKVFEEEHARNLRIDDLLIHINELAAERGILDSESIRSFNRKTNELKALIKREVSGNTGERHMIKNLKNIHVDNRFTTNVALSDGESESELDALVVTSKGIFIIENKNSTVDVQITGDGIYQETRTGKFICNIGEKMNQKEFLVRKVLKDASFEGEVQIKNIIAFSNGKSIFSNKYNYLRAGSCAVLPHWIDEELGEDIYSLDQMETIVNLIEEADFKKRYAIPFDFEEYRKLFANVLYLTEAEIVVDNIEDVKTDSIPEMNDKKSGSGINWKKVAKYSVAVAGWGLLIVTKAVSKNS